jgi:hypothetical protein
MYLNPNEIIFIEPVGTSSITTGSSWLVGAAEDADAVSGHWIGEELAVGIAAIAVAEELAELSGAL